MGIVAIDSFDDPRVAVYRDVKDRDLRLDHESFLVEGAGPLRTLLTRSRFEPESLLLSPRALRALAPELEGLPAHVPVYVAERGDYHAIVGFDMHRGCLALVRRGRDDDLSGLLAHVGSAGGAPLLVVEGITNHDNAGGLFRNARAFGAAGVLLCPRSCDPFYRKAIRTSVGASLELPFARARSWPEDLAGLRAAGLPLVALHPRPADVELADWRPPRGPFALMVGSEGPGLSEAALQHVSTRLRIAMEPGVDSINVALAAGIALHHAHVSRMAGRGIEARTRKD